MSDNNEDIHIYEITADCKKSTYQTEHWTNTLLNGKLVTLLVTTTFYWGTFEIELTNEEKQEILQKESIILNDYSVSVQELDSGCDIEHEIKNKNKYTDDEIDEINKMFLWHNEYYENSYDNSEDYPFEYDILELNKWELDDTIYGFSTGCELELISD
jgi:hypothetical protein